jgi:Carboxypeptidase regulatory-like domain
MVSRRFVTLSLLCLQLVSSCAVRSQIVSNGTLQAPSQPRTISGVVVNSVTGRPIPRVLAQAGRFAMLTDGEGRFAFRDVTDNGVLSATKPGYFPENIGGMIPWSPVAQGQPGPLELRLVPEGILSGRVTDARGTPLENVPVTLRTLVVSNGLNHWEQRGGTTTNAEGEFRFAELQAGEYAVQTALTLDGPPEGEAAAGYAPVDYPVLGVNGAGAIKMRAGDQLGADMSTRLEKLYPVSGVVNGLPEDTWPNFTVRMAGGFEVNPAIQQNPQTGEFRMLLPSGSFELRTLAYVPPVVDSSRPRAVRDAVQLNAQQRVTVAQGPVEGVRVTLQPMATIPIEVTEETIAKSQASAPSPGSADPAQMNFSLLQADADAALVAYSAERMDDRTDPAQGMQMSRPLLIRNLPPGRYFLQAQGEPPWYVASAFCGGTDLTREPFAIAASAAGCAMRLVLRDDVASLQISVSNAREDRGAPAFIYVVPLNNLTRDVQMLSTGPDGKSSLGALAPGQYLLLASRQAAQLAFRDTESLRRYETEGRRIDLAPGARAEVQLDVITGEP